LLAKAAASGRHLKTAVLSARKSGNNNQPDFFKVTLNDVIITSVMAGDDGNGATEEVALLYGEIDFSYKPQSASGALGAEVKFDWNLETGTIA
jgi:type VI secretion system secreted protein Hcp